jgi:hypothetical protein
MAEIFISFIHEEERYAQAIQRFLREALPESKLDVFVASDKWAIYAGEEWLDRIFQELKSAKVVLLILSQDSVTRPWVNFEAGAAWLKPAIVIPVCIENMTKDNLPKPYSSLQAVELEKPDDQDYLISSICHHLKYDPPLSDVKTRILAERLRAEGMVLEAASYQSTLDAFDGLRQSLKDMKR